MLDVYGVHRPDGVLQRERGCDDDPDGGCAQVGDLEAAILAAQVLGCGARVHGRCVKPTRKNKHDRKCTLLVGVHKTIMRYGTGSNSFTFTRKLATGTYQLTATPADGTSQTVTFRITG